MTISFVRRSVTGIAGLALVGGAFAAVAPTAHAAPAPNAEAKAAAAWVGTEFSGNLLAGSTGSGFGQNLDLGISLAATGASPTLLSRLRAGVDAQVENYVDTAYSVPAAAAKAAYFYSAAGGNPAEVGPGKRNLIAEVETATDETTGEFDDEYNQWWAVLALAAADSDLADEARDYLVSQACAGGGWGSDGAACGDTYSTSLALTALAEAEPSTASQAAVKEGAAWLASKAASNGSYDTCTTYDDNWACVKREADANSTGLAAVALGKSGLLAQAGRAASWIAQNQIVSFPACGVARAGNGALMWTEAHFKQGVTDDTIPNAVGATAQALAALAYLPAAAPKVSAPTGFVAAKSTVKVTVAGLRAGQQACVTGGSAPVKSVANGTVTLSVPAGTATRTLSLTTLGGTTTATLKVLGATTLKAKASAKKVKRGKKITVTVRGLAAGERVTVKIAGKKFGTATASTSGVAKVKAKVAKKTKVAKKAKITATGQFANRSGKTTIKVTK